MSKRTSNILHLQNDKVRLTTRSSSSKVKVVRDVTGWGGGSFWGVLSEVVSCHKRDP